MYPRSTSTPEQTHRRQRRLQRSRNRLLTHPSLTTAPPLPYPPSSHTSVKGGTGENAPPRSPSTNRMLRSLFDDLVRRELGVGPNDPAAHVKCRAHLERAVVVAPRPSLSDPSFLKSLSTNLPPALVSDKKAMAAVAPKPLEAPPASSSAIAAHEMLKKRRAERVSHAEKEAREAASVPTPPAKSVRATPRSASNEAEDQTTVLDISNRCTRSALRSRRTFDVRKDKTEPSCCFCPENPPVTSESQKGAELLGPFANPKSSSGRGLYVHYECACWAPQVFTDPKTNQLRRVYEEYCRGRQLKCSHCFGRGATVGCYVQKCKKVFHFRCIGAAGAYRVERFFVAYCERHAHLARKGSYKILMEAATIADVAAAYRKDDITFGLDTPHSRHTKLKRSETEVVFSRIWGVTTCASIFESHMVIFSHRRRTVLKKHERFTVGDGLRALHTSAIDVASGRLAYMAVVGRSTDSEMSAIEARAALASRDSNGIFLLRNLRGSPKWSKNHIRLIKSSSHWDDIRLRAHVVKPDTAGDRVAGSEANETSPKSASPAVGSNNEDEPTSITQHKVESKNSLEDRPRKRGRPPKRLRGQLSGSSADENTANTTPAAEVPPESVSSRLPAFKKTKRSRYDTDEAQFPTQRSKDNSLETSGNNAISPSVQGGFPDGAVQDPSLLTAHGDNAEQTRVGLKGKVKSAWETFLAEQLQRERLLRPEDSVADAMRNMARLWSLMTASERNAYEELACKSANVEVSSKKAKDEPSSLNTYLEQSKRKVGRGAGSSAAVVSKRDAGLFASGTRQGLAMDANEATKESAAAIRPVSMSLPGREKRQARGKRRIDHDQFDNLEDMFPMCLDIPKTQSGHDSGASVRKPPPPRKSR